MPFIPSGASHLLIPRIFGRSASVARCREPGGVIHDDAPSLWKFSEVQRENPGRLVAFPLELELTDHKSGVRTGYMNFEARECKPPHRFAIRIIFPVAIEHGLPAAGDSVRADECRFVGLPVAGHERVNIAAIPRIGLHLEELANLAFVTGFCCPRKLRQSSKEGCRHQNNE